MNENIVQISNITKKFGQLTAVNDVSFSIQKGEIFGLLGPNGSGKSTTIRMLCGVLTPTAGSGQIFGYDLHKETESIKKNIGYMSQQFSLYADLNVEENLSFYGEIFGLKKSVIKERSIKLIQMADLTGKEKALTGTLSGGQKQRLALSCALIHNPQLLVLDEPTAGVDPVSRRNFWKTIIQLADTGVTILVTTHYMDEAIVCDRIAFIYNGKLISIDTPEGHYKKSGYDNLEDIFISYELEKTDKSDVMSYQDMKASLTGQSGKSIFDIPR